MIAVDSNLLVYAHVQDFDQHGSALAWLGERLARSPRVGLPWPSLLAFVHLVTIPLVFTEPQSVVVVLGLGGTTDSGFARFDKLTWSSPIDPAGGQVIHSFIMID